jgi:hypothetical protein
MEERLTILAGATALERLRAGWDADSFGSMVGASGGPKWLVLSQIDRLLARRLVDGRSRPLALLGSSIGTFRHLCHSQPDALAAFDRFEAAYIAQAYEKKPTIGEVSACSAAILGALLGRDGRQAVLSNAMLSNHIVAARSRLPVASDRRVPLMLGLGAAAVANAAARGALAAFFERAVFYSGRPAFRFSGFSTQQVPLSVDNLEAAALASGSIPMVMEGVAEIAGARPGRYRDGGIVDYHFDFEFRAPDGLILFPHFFDKITPGWFDKGLKWRRARGTALDRTILVAPSREFVATLPGGRVPDRDDFRSMSTEERQARWRRVIEACRVLAEDFEELMVGDRLAAVARPIY